MKKNIAMRVASLVLMCTIVTSCFVSSTFAKYTSSIDATGTATVAKWDLSVNGTDVIGTETKPTFDLFATINDTKGGADETDVADKKIAPGTQGSFNFKIKNTSEVSMSYTVTCTMTNSNSIPIKFSDDGGATWTDSIDDINVSGNILYTDANKEVTTGDILWKWDFEVNDSQNTSDTALGSMSTAPQITLTAKIVAEQID